MPRTLIFAVVAFTATQAASREIPLAEIVSTIRQEGLQHISSGRRTVDGKDVVEDYASAMSELTRSRIGASNVFLVDASSVNDAVIASAGVLTGYRSADAPTAARGKPATGSNWLVVYLGVGQSTPTKWIVDSVTVDGNTIRLTYRKPEARFQTADGVYYYYWVPIGLLDDGAYKLELYDANLKAVTLMRRVNVRLREFD